MDEQNKPEKEEVPEEFSTLKEAGVFWDTNSTAEHEDVFEPVDVEIALPPRHGKRVILAADLAEKIDEVAKDQGVSAETLVNLWLQEKLAQAGL